MKYYKKAGYLYFYFVQIDSSMVPSSNTLAQFITALEDGLIAAFTPPVNKQILDAKVRRAEAAF